MGVEELRDAVGGICMTEEMKKAVIDNVRKRTEASGGIQEKQKIQKIQKNKNGKTVRSAKKQTGRREKAGSGWKYLAAAAVLLLVVGAAAIPVRAFVNSLVRERMEEMPQEEKSAYVETVEEAAVAADGFSRAYTEQEKARYQELAQKYQEGVFPESALPQVKSEEEAAGYEFCYLVPAATFCLPERELTDEELLEIIDFTVKRDYAYTEAYEQEHAEEIEAEELKEQEAIAGNVESGGITEQQAIEIAREKLADIFGMTGDGYEQNSYYNEPEEGRRADYCVNWTNYISHKYYYFNIDAQDGHLISATYSGEDVHREARILTTEEAQERIPQLQIAAAEVIKSMSTICAMKTDRPAVMGDSILPDRTGTLTGLALRGTACYSKLKNRISPDYRTVWSGNCGTEKRMTRQRWCFRRCPDQKTSPTFGQILESRL